MTYEEIFGMTREGLIGGDTSGFDGDFAAQVNIIGEGEGAFYIAFKDGVLAIEPYEYYDRDVILTATAEDFIKIADGSLNATLAFTTGKLKLDGSIDKALELQRLIEMIVAQHKAPAKKRAGRKPAAKKEAAPEAPEKKSGRKPAAKKEEAVSEPAPEKKRAAKKPGEKKAGKK